MTVNEKILEKIESSDTSKEVKSFLRKMLSLEFQHSEEARWRYGKDYEKYIRGYAIKHKVRGK